MSIRKALTDINAADLTSLIDNEIGEGQTIEYKRDLNLTPGPARAEFLRDISSFANANGGDLIFGIGAKDGKPQHPISPLKDFNPDQTTLQLRDLCAAHIDPPIRGIQLHAVPVEAGHALVIRVPRSWNRPHMMTYESNRSFSRRDGGGKKPMTVTELRDAFDLSSTTADRMRAFRNHRLANIKQSETPIFLSGSGVFVVLHILPLASFESSEMIDMQDIFPVALEPLAPLAWDLSGAMTRNYNFDGILTNAISKDNGCSSYVQLFRNGCIEAVNSDLLKNDPDEGSFINPLYELELANALPKYCGLLEKVGINPPFFLAISLLNIRGFEFPRIPTQVGAPRRPQIIKNADLVLPEIHVDSFPESYFELLKPAFDIIWQAGGHPKDPNYDDAGTWKYLW